MGIVHKLKPELRDFILEQKKSTPSLGCRSIAALINEKLGVKVSKSSINALLKESGLSSPIGRRVKKKRQNSEILGERLKFALRGPSVSLPEPRVEALPEAKPKEEIKIEAAPEAKLKEEPRVEALPAIQPTEEIKLTQDNLHQPSVENTEAKNITARIQEEDREVVAQPVASTVPLQEQETGCTGVIFLKALDYLLGASPRINELLCMKTGNEPRKSLALTEAALLRPLFSTDDDLSCLSSLIGMQLTEDKLQVYLSQIEQARMLEPDLARVISDIFTQARGAKMHFSDGNTVYIDSQLCTIWFSPHIPYDFSNAVSCLKSSLTGCFNEGKPLVLLSAPGYDEPSVELLHLLLNMGGANNCLESLVLYGNDLEKLESVYAASGKRYPLIFGLWPWQYSSCRKINKIGDYALIHIELLGRDVYAASIDMDLSWPSVNRSINLRGCVLKDDLKDKARLAILSIGGEFGDINELTALYLSHWPDPEDAFRDFSRKVELFTYAGSSQRPFSMESARGNENGAGAEENIFARYIKTLDAYFRWYFLPFPYQDSDFTITSERFYELEVKLLSGSEKITVRILPPEGYAFMQDLDYLIRRLNERRIKADNKRFFWFENAFRQALK
jgi:hypothetical protein